MGQNFLQALQEKGRVEMCIRDRLKGTMEVLEDSESKEMIWREGDTMYYPGGVTDPDYCVPVSYTHLKPLPPYLKKYTYGHTELKFNIKQ